MYHSNRHRITAVIFAAIFGLAGFSLLRDSSATTPAPPPTTTASSTIEPESAGIIGNAAVLSDASAAAGKATTFGYATYGPQPASMPAGAVTPEQFGAVGNGVADDTAAVQSAINAAVGKTVWLSSKTYLINNSLSVGSNTTMMGAGPSAILKFTWFYEMGAGTPGHYIKNKNAAGDSNMTFTNFVIEGAGDGMPSGIDSQNPYQLAPSLRLGNVITNFSITHMEIRNSPGLSVSYHGGQNGVISYNYVHNSGRDGITGFWAPGTAGTNTNITVSYNYVSKTGDDMIGINGLPTGKSNSISLPSNITIINNTVEDWYTDPNGKAVARGIFLVGVRGALVQNNSIINTSANSPGILLTGAWGIFGTPDSTDPATGQPWISANVTVKDNTIYNAGQLPGILSQGKGNGSGILVDTTRDSTITGNRIINAKYTPLRNDGCNIGCNIQNNPTN